MANNNNKNKNDNKTSQNNKPKKPFTNPINHLWGKIIVWVLAIAMAGAGLFTIIYQLVKVWNG